MHLDIQGTYLFHVILAIIIDYFRIGFTNREEEGGGICGESRLLQGEEEEEEENYYCSEGYQAVPACLSGKDRL